MHVALVEVAIVVVGEVEDGDEEVVEGGLRTKGMDLQHARTTAFVWRIFPAE